MNPGDLRAAHLAGAYDTSPPSCPGCLAQGGMTQVLPERPATVRGLESKPARWACMACGWEGHGTRVVGVPTLRLEVVDPETGHVGAPAVSEAEQCFREQEHMRVGRTGGGSKGRRTPKPGDNEQLTKRPEQEAPGIRDKASTSTVVERRTVIRTFRLTPSEDALLHVVAKGLGLDLRDAVVSGLQEIARRA